MKGVKQDKKPRIVTVSHTYISVKHRSLITILFVISDR